MEETHNESNSPVKGPHGDQSCALGATGTTIPGQELGFDPGVLLFHSNVHKPKAILEAQNWELQFLTVGLASGHILNIKKK